MFEEEVLHINKKVKAVSLKKRDERSMVKEKNKKTLPKKDERTDKRKVRKIKSPEKSGEIDKRKIKSAIKKVKAEKKKEVKKAKLKSKPSNKQKPQLKGIKVVVAKKTMIQQPKKRSQRKTTNVFNVGTYIRKNTKLNVSPGFVDEIISRIKDNLDTDVMEAEQIATSMSMKTLMEVHAVRIYDYRIPDKTSIISCDNCGNSFAIATEKVSKKMCCPFCGQKRYMRFE